MSDRANPNRITPRQLADLTDPAACCWLALALGLLALALNSLEFPVAVCCYPWLGGCATILRAWAAWARKTGAV